MSIKVFYKPDTLQIIGISDGEISMSKYPYIEYDNNKVPHTTESLVLEKIDGQIVVKPSQKSAYYETLFYK